jgi:hypothetical protein
MIANTSGRSAKIEWPNPLQNWQCQLVKVYVIFMMVAEILFMLYYSKHVTHQGGWTK